jgi:hypothetical protein
LGQTTGLLFTLRAEQPGGAEMANGPRLSKYVVDFFPDRGSGSDSRESIRLEADSDSDAIEQAKWLARRTVHHHYQVRAAAGNIHVVIFVSGSAIAV